MTVIQTIGSLIRTELQQSSSNTKAAKVIIGHQEIKTSIFSPLSDVIRVLFKNLRNLDVSTKVLRIFLNLWTHIWNNFRFFLCIILNEIHDSNYKHLVNDCWLTVSTNYVDLII